MITKEEFVEKLDAVLKHVVATYAAENDLTYEEAEKALLDQ